MYGAVIIMMTMVMIIIITTIQRLSLFVDEQHIPLSKALGSALTVKEIWQRIVYDQWIVGIDMENTSER